MNEINRNFAQCDEYSEDSFLAILHEKSIWEDKEYFKLENYIYDLNKQYSGEEYLPRSVFWPAMSVYSYLMILISCHFDPRDGFVVEGLDRELYGRKERVQLVFEGLFRGEIPGKDSFEY